MGCVGVGQTSNFHEAYVLGGKLWQGDYAQVRICKKAYEADDLAVRVIDLRKIGSIDPARGPTDALRRRQAQNEVQVMAKVGTHENVVQFIEAIWEGPLLYIVHECVDYGLLYILERMPLLNEQTLSKFFKAALLALKHIHSKGIVHCDVRLDNFLVCGTEFTFKLTGFKHARILLNSEHTQGAAYLYSIGPHPSNMSPYMSPEMISEKGFEYKTDVWSLGVVVYLLFYGQNPYKPKANTEESMKEAILVGEPPPTYEPWMLTQRETIYSKAAMTFLKALLDRKVDERPTASEALEYPYIKLADGTEGREVAQKQKLLPHLCGALRAGAFEFLSSKDEETDVDMLLNYSQCPYHGPIHSWTPERPHASILKAAMDATQPATAEDGDAIQALRKMRQGETAREIGKVMRGPQAQEGEFSIALGDLKKMRKGEVFNELNRIMPTRSEDVGTASKEIPAGRKTSKKDKMRRPQSKENIEEDEEQQDDGARQQLATEEGVVASAVPPNDDELAGPVTIL